MLTTARPSVDESLLGRDHGVILVGGARRLMGPEMIPSSSRPELHQLPER